MPKKDGDEFILSETGNWNVASDYSRLARIRTSVKLIKGGRANVIRKNIKSLQQVSRGRVAVVRGQKLIRSGVKARGINVNDFASISSTFTKKDLILKKELELEL